MRQLHQREQPLSLPAPVQPIRERNPFAGVVDLFRIDKRPSQVLTFLSEAKTNRTGDSQKALDKAVQLFGELSDSQRTRVLGQVQWDLNAHTTNPFDSVETAYSVRRLADFFIGALEVRHPHKRGYPVDDHYKRFIELFRKIIETPEVDGDRHVYIPAVIACTKALWEVGYFDEKFWTDRLIQDPNTRPFAIAALLEMPMVNTTLIDREGLLRNLGKEEIEESSSSWKYEFLGEGASDYCFDLDYELRSIASDLLWNYRYAGPDGQPEADLWISQLLKERYETQKIVYCSPWGNTGLPPERWKEMSNALAEIASNADESLGRRARKLLRRLAAEYRPGAVDAQDDNAFRYERQSRWQYGMDPPADYDYFRRR